MAVQKRVFRGPKGPCGSKEETKIAEPKHLFSLSVFPGAGFKFRLLCCPTHFASSPSASKVSHSHSPRPPQGPTAPGACMHGPPRTVRRKHTNQRSLMFCPRAYHVCCNTFSVFTLRAASACTSFLFSPMMSIAARFSVSVFCEFPRASGAIYANRSAAADRYAST